MSQNVTPADEAGKLMTTNGGNPVEQAA